MGLNCQLGGYQRKNLMHYYLWVGKRLKFYLYLLTAKWQKLPIRYVNEGCKFQIADNIVWYMNFLKKNIGVTL